MRDYLLNFIFKFQRRFVGFYRKSKRNLRSELSTAVLTDFPKAFDCVPRNLLVAELVRLNQAFQLLIENHLLLFQLILRTQNKKRIWSVLRDFSNVLYGVPWGHFQAYFCFLLFHNYLLLMTNWIMSVTRKNDTQICSIFHGSLAESRGSYRFLRTEQLEHLIAIQNLIVYLRHFCIRPRFIEA